MYVVSLDGYLSNPSDSGIQNLHNTQSNFAFNRWKKKLYVIKNQEVNKKITQSCDFFGISCLYYMLSY